MRFDAGRHGLLALRELSRSETEGVAERARIALAEANWRDHGPLARGQDQQGDKQRFLARIEVYPKGKALADDLMEKLFAMHQKNRWVFACLDQGPPCAALSMDLDGDGEDEAVVGIFGEGAVYARKEAKWVKVGRLQPRRYKTPGEQSAALI